MTFAVFAPVRGHEGVELHGVRLHTEAKEGAKGRLVGYQGLLSIRDTSLHPRPGVLGRWPRQETEGGKRRIWKVWVLPSARRARRARAYLNGSGEGRHWGLEAEGRGLRLQKNARLGVTQRGL